MKRFALVTASALVLAACQEAPQPFQAEDGAQMGAVGQPLERMVVVFEAGTENVPQLANALTGQYGRAPSFIYQVALEGFAAELPEQAARALASHPAVAYVEPDRERSIFAQTVPTGIDRIFATGNTSLDIDGTDDHRVDVDVAIIDTGIDYEHPDLDVRGGVDCAGGGPFGGSCSSGGDDDHYHGTHVAGTVAAIDDGSGVVGVAPGARLWAVKVLNQRGSGYTSWIVAGIDWVAANAATIEVANMSLGGSGFSQAEYDAIQGAVDAGVAFAVAAGNSGADAADYSPAAFDNVLTVSALADFDGLEGGLGNPTCRSDQDDTLADFSNWGDAVQIAAPGVCILSTFPLEQGEYGTISGTSMASPHAAGALALLASSSNPENAADVFNLYDDVIGAGNVNWTDDSGDGTREPLLDVSSFAPTLIAGGSGNDDDGATNRSPTASIVDPPTCSGLTCTFDGSGSSDSDGSITAYDWDLGDGQSGTGATLEHTYATGGTFTVTLTVTDDGDATGSTTLDVTVSEPSPGGVSLSVTGYKVRGLQKADLSWSGSTASSFDVYRDDLGLLAAGVAGSSYTDNIDQRGGGSYAYQVCEAGTGTCSSWMTVSF